jgi:transposase InsO family protein
VRSDVPQAIAQLVMACLEKAPEDRPETASTFIREIAQVVRGGHYRFPQQPEGLSEPGGGADPDRGRSALVADITYIRLEEEFVHLVVILDAFSRRVIGWHLGETIEVSLTLNALRMALELGTLHPPWRVAEIGWVSPQGHK